MQTVVKARIERTKLLKCGGGEKNLFAFEGVEYVCEDLLRTYQTNKHGNTNSLYNLVVLQ